MSNSISPSTSSQTLTPTSPSGGGTGGFDDGKHSPAAFVREVQKQQEEILFVVRAALKVLKTLAHFVSYPILILFRRNLGERMLSGTAFLIVWTITCCVAFASGVNLAYALALGLPVMYGVHAFKITRRSKRGIRHYSYCRGNSWLDVVLPRTPELNSSVLEPLVLIVTATVVYFCGGHLMVPEDATQISVKPVGPWVCSAYIAAMGVGLFFVESLLRKQEHNTLLDHIDQQIISTYFAAALGDNDEIADEGFGVAELATWTPEQRGVLADAIGMPVFSWGNPDDGTAFDPTWDHLLDPTPAPGSFSRSQERSSVV